MSKEEYKEKIKELEYFINDQELRKARNFMFMCITLISILGGGLVLGLLFHNLAKIMMLAIAIGVFTNAGTIKILEDANAEIKRCNHQISVYKEDLSKLESKGKTLVKKQTKEVKKDYSYKPENNKNKKEVKIERFTEEDFLEENNRKSR